nr:MAG TPA: hypothetical protein [Caudoviricetes sp.]
MQLSRITTELLLCSVVASSGRERKQKHDNQGIVQERSSRHNSNVPDQIWSV